MRTITLCFITAFAILAGLSPARAADSVRLTNGEWPPFQSENLPHYGPYSHIAKLAFAEVGMEVEFGFFPWNRAVKLVQDGHWDGTFFWVATPEREQDFLLSDTVITFREVIFFSKDNPLKVQSIEDFSGLTMGRIQSSAFGHRFDDLIKSGQVHVTEVPTNENLFQMLASGRVDFVPELYHSGTEAIQALAGRIDSSRIGFDPRFGQDWNYHMMISRKTENGAEILAKFNQGLAKLKQKGLIEDIMAPITNPAIPSE